MSAGFVTGEALAVASFASVAVRDERAVKLIGSWRFKSAAEPGRTHSIRIW